MTQSAFDPRLLPPLLTARQIAEVLHLHINTVKKLCRTGKLPAFKAGAVWRIRREDLLAFVQSGAGADGLAAGAEQAEAPGAGQPGMLPGQRLALLREIDRAILAAHSPAEIARAAAEGALRAIGAARVVVALWQAQDDMMEVLAVAGTVNPRLKPGARLAILPWPWFPALRQGQVAFVDDLAQVPDLFPEAQAALAQGIRSQVVMPLLIGGRPIGHLALSRRNPGRLPDDDLALAQQVTDALAIAMHHARLLEAEQQARQTLETLQGANLTLTQSLDLDTVLANLLDYLAELIPYDSANVMLRTGDDTVAVRATRGYERWTDGALIQDIAFDIQATPAIREMFDRRQSLCVPDVAQYAGWETRPGAEHVKSWLAVPLIVQGRVLGLFSVDKVEAGFFRPEHVRLAEALAPQAAVAIQNARLFAEVQDRRHQLQALSRRLVEVQEQERRTLSRDLHDTSGQNITALKFGLSMLKRAEGASEEVWAGVDRLVQLADTVAEDLHRLAVNLRPASLDRYGLVPALEQLLTEFHRSTGVEVDFAAPDIEGRTERLPGGVETALFRIVQESLTNATRYAQARLVTVLLQRTDGGVQVIVEDDGRGFDVERALRSGRLGLLGMRERMEMLGGTLEIESSPGYGTTIYATLPDRPVEDQASELPVEVAHIPQAVAAAADRFDTATHLAEAAELARAKALSDALVEITAGMARCTDAGAVLRLVLAHSAEALGCDNAHIAIREADDWELRYGYREGGPTRRFADLDAPAFRWVERTRQVLVVNDTSAGDLAEPLRLAQLGLKSYACVPLSAGDRLLGVLSFANYAVPAPFHASEVAFLNRLATLVALALENVRLHQSETHQRAELAERVEQLERMADQLALSEAKYRTIAQGFPNGFVYIFDRDLRYQVADGELLGDLADTLAGMEGKTLWEVFDKATARILEPRYRRALAGEPLHAETNFGTPAEGRTLAADYRPLRDGSGQVVAVLVSVHDVSVEVRARNAAEAQAAAARAAQEEAEHLAAERAAILDAFAEGLVIYDAAGRIWRMNRVAETILGYTLQKGPLLVGEVLDRLEARKPDGRPFPPADYPARRALAGATVQGEVMAIERSGATLWLSASAAPILGPDGRRRGAVGTFTDITPLHAAQEQLEETYQELEVAHEELQTQAEELAEAGERYRQLFTALNEGFVLVEMLYDEQDRPWDYRHLDMNPAAERLTGLPREAVLGQTIRELNPHVDAERIAACGRVARTGQPERYANYSAITERWYESRFYRPGPDLVAMLIEDVTEQKRAESARETAHQLLQQSEATYRAIAQNYPNGAVYVFDRDLRYQVVEGELLSALGQTPAGMEGKTIEQAFDEATVQTIAPRYRRALAGESLHFETRYGEQFGNRIFASDYRPICDRGGQVVAGLLVVQDISERRRAESQREAALAALREANAELEAILAAMPDGLIVYDAAGHTVRASEVARQALGWSAATWQRPVGERVTTSVQLYDPGGRPLERDEYVALRAMRGEHVRGAELRVHLPEHPENDMWALFSASPIRDLEGQIAGALVTWANTTGLREANEQLAQANLQLTARAEQLRAATEQLRDAAANLEQRVQARTAELTSANARLSQGEAALRRQSQRLALLHEIDRAILAARAPHEIAQGAIEKVRQMAQAQRVTVVLCDFAAGVAEILAAAGAGTEGYQTGAHVPLAQYPMIEVVRTGRVATVEDMRDLPDDWPPKVATLRAGIRSVSLLPLILGGQVLGALSISRAETGPLPSEIGELFGQVADSLAVAIYNAGLHQQVQAGRDQLQALSRRLVDAQEHERRIVANQLYNQAAQVLAAAKLNLAILGQTLGDPEAAQRLRETQDMLDGAMRELHTVATGLHPASLARLGLAAALGQYVADFGKRYGLAASMGAEDLAGRRVRPEIETALYRIAQEALANVAEHSAATDLQVLLSRFEDRLMLIVEDNGRGFDLAGLDQQTALGLASMRERAESVGGQLTIETRPGHGTTILVAVPVQAGPIGPA